MAASEPGTRFETRGVSTMRAMLATPTAAAGHEMVVMLSAYTTHFVRKSPGMRSTVSPSRSLICVVKMVRAMPLVKPTMMG